MDVFFSLITNLCLYVNQDEEEWREFEEEKKDYSGLKIGNLTVNDNHDGDSDDQRGTGENSSDGESGETSSKLSGPWKKADAPPQADTTEQVQQPQVPTTTTATVGQKYKSPHLRHQTTSSPSTRSSRMKNVAPDIRSEEYFPTLNAKQPAAVEPTGWGRRWVYYLCKILLLKYFLANVSLQF